MKRFLIAFFSSIAAFSCWAKGDYLTLEAFLELAFEQAEPEQEALWFTSDQRVAIKDLLGQEPGTLRQRYWGSGTRTAWILEEIGKERPITIGIAVDGERISRVEILTFRESRGWEVRYPFFTEQFVGLELNDKGRLSQNIDGITGATLSVRAVKKVAQLALFLHSQTPYAE